MENTGISTRVGIAGAVGIALFLAMVVGLRILGRTLTDPTQPSRTTHPQW